MLAHHLKISRLGRSRVSGNTLKFPPLNVLAAAALLFCGLVGCFWANGEITHVPHKNAADTVETLFGTWGDSCTRKKRLLSLKSDGGVTKRRDERVRGGFVLFTIKAGPSDGDGTGLTRGSDNNVARPNRYRSPKRFRCGCPSRLFLNRASKSETWIPPLLSQPSVGWQLLGRRKLRIRSVAVDFLLLLIVITMARSVPDVPWGPPAPVYSLRPRRR